MTNSNIEKMLGDVHQKMISSTLTEMLRYAECVQWIHQLRHLEKNPPRVLQDKLDLARPQDETEKVLQDKLDLASPQDETEIAFAHLRYLISKWEDYATDMRRALSHSTNTSDGKRTTEEES